MTMTKISTKETENFLAKLSKINFTNADSNSLISEDWKVKLNFKILSEVHAWFRIQVVVNVFYKGNHATSWGSDSNESNDVIALWFLKAKMKAEDLAWEESKLCRSEAEDAFNSL